MVFSLMGLHVRVGILSCGVMCVVFCLVELCECGDSVLCGVMSVWGFVLWSYV